MEHEFNFENLESLTIPGSTRGKRNKSNIITLNEKYGYIYFSSCTLHGFPFKEGDCVSLKYMPSKKEAVIGVSEKDNPFKITSMSGKGLKIMCKGAVRDLTSMFNSNKAYMRIEGEYVFLAKAKYSYR